MNDTLLVTGIHRDELGFGEGVARVLPPGTVDVIRIPQGIPQPRRGPGEQFYSRTEHREIYLQLHQQVRGRYRLMIDLHKGLDETGRGAEIFCHDEALLGRIGAALPPGAGARMRLIRIGTGAEAAAAEGPAEAEARTWIPRRIWSGRTPVYVGLEVYLGAEGDGSPEDWGFAALLVEAIRAGMREAENLRQ